MSRSRPVMATCDRCGRRTPAKKLTRVLSGFLCPKCLDHIPSAERRMLLRRASKEAR